MGANCDFCEKNPAMGRYIVILEDGLPDVSLCDKCGSSAHPTLPELRSHFASKLGKELVKTRINPSWGSWAKDLAEPVFSAAGKGTDATANEIRSSPQASASPSPSPAVMGDSLGEGAADGDTQSEASPLPGERLSRLGGPSTSLEAARLAAKASKKAMTNVQRVMADGRPRIDEELWEACRESGYVTSLATVQHGRLALSEAGILEDTGKTKVTSNGCKSRVWRMKLQTALAI